jgi:hypothetical protein
MRRSLAINSAVDDKRRHLELDRDALWHGYSQAKLAGYGDDNDQERNAIVDKEAPTH